MSLAIGRDHTHLQTGMRTSKKLIEEPLMMRNRTPLAKLEKPRPIGRRRDAVREVGVGIAGDIGQIGGIHAHLAPHAPLVEGGFEALLADRSQGNRLRSVVRS